METIAIRLEKVKLRLFGTSTLSTQELDLAVVQGSVVICHGQIGSGKTLLCKAILGEISPANGVVMV